MRIPEAGVLTAKHVAWLYGVDPKTVVRWANAGKVDSFRTRGGHRRYPRQQFAALIAKVLPEERHA